jgi:predicted RNA binding protein YcfA (HicA-like mRNA interferase family)
LKLPRDLRGDDLAKKLAIYGYIVTRQSGSHMRLTTQSEGEHHLTIPAYRSIPVDILDSVIGDVASHRKVKKSVIIDELFR